MCEHCVCRGLVMCDLCVCFRAVLHREVPRAEPEDPRQALLPAHEAGALHTQGVHQEPLPQPRDHDTAPWCDTLLASCFLALKSAN